MERKERRVKLGGSTEEAALPPAPSSAAQGGLRKAPEAVAMRESVESVSSLKSSNERSTAGELTRADIRKSLCGSMCPIATSGVGGRRSIEGGLSDANTEGPSTSNRSFGRRKLSRAAGAASPAASPSSSFKADDSSASRRQNSCELLGGPSARAASRQFVRQPSC